MRKIKFPTDISYLVRYNGEEVVPLESGNPLGSANPENLLFMGKHIEHFTNFSTSMVSSFIAGNIKGVLTDYEPIGFGHLYGMKMLIKSSSIVRSSEPLTEEQAEDVNNNLVGNLTHTTTSLGMLYAIGTLTETMLTQMQMASALYATEKRMTPEAKITFLRAKISILDASLMMALEVSAKASPVVFTNAIVTSTNIDGEVVTIADMIPELEGSLAGIVPMRRTTNMDCVLLPLEGREDLVDGIEEAREDTIMSRVMMLTEDDSITPDEVESLFSGKALQAKILAATHSSADGENKEEEHTTTHSSSKKMH